MTTEFEPGNRIDEPKTQPHGLPGWVIGLGLVLVGILFLLQNLNIIGPIGLMHNWWALFILIPAVNSFYKVFRDLQANGALTPASRDSIVSGLLLTFLAAIFLFDLDWGKFWPVFLIIFGLGALLKNRDK